MNFSGLIDFTKYTLAIAAAGFAYTLETFSPMPTPGGRWFLLGVLALFLSSAVLGVVVFAAATTALGDDQTRTEKIEKLMPRLGTAHAVLLSVALLISGAMVAQRVLTEPFDPPKCCCERNED